MRFARRVPLAAAVLTVLMAGFAVPPPATALPAVQFGLLGLARGQTMRVNVVNTLAPDANVGPCVVRATFADEQGLLFGDRSGDETALLPGQATWIDLPASLVVGRNSLTARTRVRATVEANPGPPDVPPNPCLGIVSTLEIFDNLTGRTAAFENNPGPPDVEGQSNPPTFGLLGLARLQVLALTAINLAPPSDPDVDLPPSPCRVGLTFLTAAGQVVRGRDGRPIARRAELLPGGFLTLNLQAAIAFDNTAALRVPIRAFVQQQPGPPDTPPSPCAGLTTTLELVDALTGRTSLIYAVGAQPGPPNTGR